MSTTAATITIELNGEPHALSAGSTLADLVTDLGRDPRTVAIEHNRQIVRRESYAQTPLSSGDQVEVVHFVQGG